MPRFTHHSAAAFAALVLALGTIASITHVPPARTAVAVAAAPALA